MPDLVVPPIKISLVPEIFHWGQKVQAVVHVLRNEVASPRSHQQSKMALRNDFLSDRRQLEALDTVLQLSKEMKEELEL